MAIGSDLSITTFPHFLTLKPPLILPFRYLASKLKKKSLSFHKIPISVTSAQAIIITCDLFFSLLNANNISCVRVDTFKDLVRLNLL